MMSFFYNIRQRDEKKKWRPIFAYVERQSDYKKSFKRT